MFALSKPPVAFPSANRHRARRALIVIGVSLVTIRFGPWEEIDTILNGFRDFLV